MTTKILKQTGLICMLFAISLPTYSQTCNASTVETTPDADFSVNNNGTVTHSPTGLMWKVCAEGQTWDAGSCLSSPEKLVWSQALAKVQVQNSTGYAGHSDWRLPNLKELLSIVEFSCADPTINSSIFIATVSTGYWTSTPGASHSSAALSGEAFGVHFKEGEVISRRRDQLSVFIEKTEHARLVRNIP